MANEMHTYTVQVLTRFDAFTGKLRRNYFTKEYRQIVATSAEKAELLCPRGHFDATGSVHQILNSEVTACNSNLSRSTNRRLTERERAEYQMEIA